MYNTPEFAERLQQIIETVAIRHNLTCEHDIGKRLQELVIKRLRQPIPVWNSEQTCDTNPPFGNAERITEEAASNVIRERRNKLTFMDLLVAIKESFSGIFPFDDIENL